MSRTKLMPIFEKILVDTETPISIFMKLAHLEPAYLLESVEQGEWVGRYSFIGIDPILSVKHNKGKNTINFLNSNQEQVIAGGPIEALQSLMASYELISSDDFPPFFGGLVGYLGYEFIHYYERVTKHNQGKKTTKLEDIPECYLVFCQTVLIYDHVQQCIRVVYLAEEDDSSRLAALQKINEIKELIANHLGKVSITSTPQTKVSATPNMSKVDFKAKVAQAKEYIKSGDIFQVVLSQQFKAPVTADPFTIYRRLRSLNPSPYLFFLNFPEFKIIGSSPEMLIKVENSLLETRPIAGTRPRGKNSMLDDQLADDLLKDEKEKAEHLMLVDLGRNDIGRVAEIGSVKLTQFMEIEKYSHVMHLVSVVQGKLAKEKSAGDAIKSCFPAGTVSGAPKIRAMEIIDELEPTKRGVYAGAILYFGLTGNLDSCIAIRTIVLKDDSAYVQAGAGIVNDSCAESEYWETVNKAKVLLMALGAELEEERGAEDENASKSSDYASNIR